MKWLYFVIFRWEYFNHVVPNRNIQYLESDFRMICALINKCRPSIASEKMNEKDTALKILELSQKKNPLKAFVSRISNRLDKSKIIHLNELFFPRLSEEYIKSLTFGVYQLKQVIKYKKKLNLFKYFLINRQPPIHMSIWMKMVTIFLSSMTTRIK